MFIAIEGIDAAGKHTQTDMLKEYFEKLGGRTVTKLDFPHYDSLSGQIVLDHLKGKWRVERQRIDSGPGGPYFTDDSSAAKLHELSSLYAGDPSTYLFQCAQLVNRLECLPDAAWSNRPEDVLISDRYNASAYAYGIAFGLDFDWLVKTHRHLPQPDLNVFLDITVEESFRRRPERRDNYERNGDMLRRVRQCYLDVFERLGPSYVVLDASAPVDETFELILKELRTRGML